MFSHHAFKLAYTLSQTSKSKTHDAQKKTTILKYYIRFTLYSYNASPLPFSTHLVGVLFDLPPQTSCKTPSAEWPLTHSVVCQLFAHTLKLLVRECRVRMPGWARGRWQVLDYVYLKECHRTSCKLTVFENMKMTRVGIPLTQHCLTAPHLCYGAVLEQKRWLNKN